MNPTSAPTVIAVDLPPRSAWAVRVDVLIVILTLLAPALGGSTRPWAQALLVLAAGVLMLATPPRRVLPDRINVALGFWAVLAFVPLLPAAVFPALPWRGRLRGELQIEPAGTLSLQPWLTLEGAALLIAGIAWGSFLLTHRWELTRRRLVELYAGGILALTIGALAVYFLNLDFPLWKVEAGRFGFFPHRNQTANLLALGGMITLALAVEEFRRRHKLWMLWAASCLLVAAGLVINYSRAGILLFFFGSLIWLVWVGLFSRSSTRLGFGLASLFFLFALFVMFGGQTLNRFRPADADSDSPVLDFRILLQRDALDMAGPASWHGLGIGNFEPVFTQYRHDSINGARALHPDSDWLWLWMEIGWPALLALGYVLAWALRRCFPFARQSERRLRSAAFLCILFFLLHGFVDVGGHRLGTLWPALLLLSVAQFPGHELPARRWAPVLFRGLGGLLVALGIVWLASAAGFLSTRSSATLDRIRHGLGRAAEAKRYAEVIELADRGLRIAPLDWRLYFNRAGAEAIDLPGEPAAVLDFKRARHLEPHSPQVPLQEGMIWLGRDTARAMTAWQEALRRLPPNEPDLYPLMMLAAAKFPEAREALWALTGDSGARKMLFFRQATPEEFRRHLDTLLAADSHLNVFGQAQLKELFAIWAQKGDPATLEKHLLANPEWLAAGSYWLATFHAQAGNFQAACEVARRNHTPPTMPRAIPLNKSLRELQQEFQSRPRDFSLGLSLYREQVKGGQPEAALATLRQLIPLPQCPNYFSYLEAELLVSEKRWEEAWTAWKRYTGDGLEAGKPGRGPGG